MVILAKQGKISKEDVDISYACWKTHAEWGNSYHLIRGMNDYYKKLWKEIDI